jgi:hypothetical protein
MFVRFRIAKAGLMAGDVIKSIMVGRYSYSLNEVNSFIKAEKRKMDSMEALQSLNH